MCCVIVIQTSLLMIRIEYPRSLNQSVCWILATEMFLGWVLRMCLIQHTLI